MTDEENAVGQEQEGGIEDEQQELSDEEKLMAELKEAIEVKTEEIGSLRRKLTITVPRKLLDERMGEQFQELRRDALVPGFRKGRAPMSLVEKRFAPDVGEQVSGQVVHSGYTAAVEKEDLKPLGDPLIWTTIKEKRNVEGGGTRKVDTEKLMPLDRASEHIKIPQEGDLTFSCEIDLKPQFELPNLEGITLKKPALSVKDEHIDQEIDRLRTYQGTFEPVSDGAIEEDDLLFADIRITVGDEELVFEQNFDLPARDTLVKGFRLEGFQKAIVGKKAGEEVSIELPVPDDHENVGIRGKTATFTATVREMKRFSKAALDEAFLSMLGVDSEEDLRANVSSAIESQIDSLVKRNYYDQIKEYLLESTDFELPEGMSQRLTEQTLSRRRIDMLRNNTPQDEVDKEIDKMRGDAEAETIREMKLLFIVEQAAEERDISVGEEEINGAIASIAARQNKRFDRVRDELSKGNGMWNLYLQLRDEKVLDGIVENAKIEDAPAEETSKGDSADKSK